jgi:hypothetical protein
MIPSRKFIKNINKKWKCRYCKSKMDIVEIVSNEYGTTTFVKCLKCDKRITKRLASEGLLISEVR